MNYVVGSGPAGVAAATALVARGVPVTMLDAGGALDPAASAAAARLASRPVEVWTAADRQAVQGPLRMNSEGAPLKLAYGSDYVYRDVDRWQPVDADGVEAYRGFAAGGLSALWGGAILPFAARDLDGWPVGLGDLEPHYRAALALTGLAASADRLAAEYPLYIPPTMPLPLGAQARQLLDSMEHHAVALAERGVTFGRARLALASPPAAPGLQCQECGLCLYGCPWGLIYNAEATLRQLSRRTDLFTYEAGVVVRRVVERADGVTIEGVSTSTGDARHVHASRVFLATGAIASTAILLASLPGIRQVELRQSEHFLVPLLLRRAPGRPSGERLQTLSQLFIEMASPLPGARPAHLQVYTYNDFYERMGRARLGLLYPLVAPLASRLIDRLVLVKGYLHSDDSRGLEARLVTRPGGDRLRLAATPQPRAEETVRAVVRRLVLEGRRLGLRPVPGAWRLGLPGSSVHVGAAFPMSSTPAGAASDVLGRPAGLSRVHVVDASVFPTLPAAPPTLTVMANAMRIAHATCGLGGEA